MWVERRDEQDLTKRPQVTVSQRIIINIYHRLKSEATQQASYFFQYTVKIIVQRPKEIESIIITFAQYMCSG